MRVNRIHIINNGNAGISSLMANAVLLETPIEEEDVVIMNSKVLWKNELDGATLTATPDASNLINLYDNMTTQKWTAGTGTVDLDIAFSGTKIDCVGIAAGNWKQAGATIEVWNQDPVTPVKLADVSGLDDDAPHLFVFDEVTISALRIRFISTSSLRVGQVGAGLAMTFPCAPTLGLELGQFNNNDEELGVTTEGNAFGGATLLKRSRQTVAPFQDVSITWIRANWIPFSNTHKGKLVWFIWDHVNSPNDTIFGQWSTRGNLNYSRATYTNINFVVTGHAR